jgi:hypothetical protein
VYALVPGLLREEVTSLVPLSLSFVIVVREKIT